MSGQGAFRPYESPLRGFRGFAEQPDMMANAGAAGNYDTRVPLCPMEGQYGACQDPMCGFQHFADMSLPTMVSL